MQWRLSLGQFLREAKVSVRATGYSVRRFWLASLVCLSAFGALTLPSRAEGPYFVTYDHHMEEPGNLEIGINSVHGKPTNGHSFLGAWTELEYGTKAWWTT